MMKRITQVLASILFIITVLTVYLAFDFAINNALPKQYSTDKYDEKLFKTTTTSSSGLSLLKIKKFNQTFKDNNNNNEQHHINDQERRTRSVKQKQQQHGKLAQFHKSKTGVKINQIKKSVKQSRKRLLTTKNSQRKSSKSTTDKTQV